MATRCGSRRGSAHCAIRTPAGQQIPIFKSWGTPDVDPAACAHTFFSHSHRILAPTTTFMTKRREIQTRQGRDGLWFAGGWTNWFDSQEAALDSATDIAAQVSGGVTAVGPVTIQASLPMGPEGFNDGWCVSPPSRPRGYRKRSPAAYELSRAMARADTQRRNAALALRRGGGAPRPKIKSALTSRRECQRFLRAGAPPPRWGRAPRCGTRVSTSLCTATRFTANLVLSSALNRLLRQS